MKKVSVDAIEDGMVLAREVCGISGNILLRKGSVVTVALGKRLKNWGIPLVYIEGDDDERQKACENEISPEVVKDVLMKKFSDVFTHPLMRKIFVAAYNCRIHDSRK